MENKSLIIYDLNGTIISEAINGVKLVPSVYRGQVKAKLIEWSK